MRPLPEAFSCQNLSCGYPGRVVLTGIDLTLQPGGITALLGPNGSGKSTLLRTIVGEIPAISGGLQLCGKASQDFSARERAQTVAFVPSEERTEFPFLAREIVAMGRIPYSEGLFDSVEDKRITEESLARVECTHLANRPITNVSAGERQRILIARALAQQAPIMLLDEPTSHLDPGHQVSFVMLVKQLASTGLSILVALHDLNLAAHLADRLVLLNDGKIAISGPARDVLESTALDDAYGTRFERIKGSDGIVRLSPLFPRV
jgi:iron complex transport system ATP-binding protein